LVQARKDQRLLYRVPTILADAFDPFQMHEAADNVQPCITLKHTLPQIGCPITDWVRRIPSATAVTEVERQKTCGTAGQLGRHVDLIGADCKVNQRATLEC